MLCPASLGSDQWGKCSQNIMCTIVMGLRVQSQSCANTPEYKSCNSRHSTCLVLQFLKDISEHRTLSQAAVAPVLAISLKQDLEAEDRGLSAVTSDLLSMWKQACPKPWMLQLTAEAASTLAVLFTREQHWSEAAAIYETGIRASQVIIRLSPRTRLAKVIAATSVRELDTQLFSCVELSSHVWLLLLSFDCTAPCVHAATARCG